MSTWVVHFTNGETLEVQGDEDDARLVTSDFTDGVRGVQFKRTSGLAIFVNPRHVTYIVQSTKSAEHSERTMK